MLLESLAKAKSLETPRVQVMDLGIQLINNMGIHLEKLGEIIGWVGQKGFKNVQKPYLKDH